MLPLFFSLESGPDPSGPSFSAVPDHPVLLKRGVCFLPFSQEGLPLKLPLTFPGPSGILTAGVGAPDFLGSLLGGPCRGGVSCLLVQVGAGCTGPPLEGVLLGRALSRSHLLLAPQSRPSSWFLSLSRVCRLALTLRNHANRVAVRPAWTSVRAASRDPFSSG